MLLIKPLNDLSIYLNHLIQGRLWLKVVIGILVGVLVGIFLNPDSGFVSDSLSQSLANWLNLPGEIFMKLVQMVMIPLIFASIISGLASNVTDNLKSFGLWLLIYFIFTTIVAISIGTLMAYIFNPGEYVSSLGGFSSAETLPQTATSQSLEFNIPKTISNLIPVNPLEAILTGEMLSVVIFTIIIGVAITQLEPGTASPLMRFIEALQKICMIVVGWAMQIVPFAVFGLMAALLSKTGFSIIIGLGYYILVVLVGLLILTIFYLIVYSAVKRESPFKFLAKIKDAQLLAFSTASSAAVMPLSMKVADEKLGVSSKVSDFVIPIGATINMDGTALFQCVTVLFMAQAYGIHLGVPEVLLITFTIVAASIGTPAIPGGGVIILSTVLQSSGIPVEGLVVIIGIDRILGMFRTAVNVTGDLTATAIFNQWFGDPD
ncbi:dicarboxylate/amino acid:cation symporter [Jiulongibacter sp. NS-SX5]|uniref:dicarboxylate/amino acid:cation symporter n=1 Tax=Jiulongibacter sp. NS-SX5 TaxID=3463854 RepID=UPI004059347F